MRVLSPQADLPSGATGGSELFGAEAVVDADLFYVAPPPSGSGTVFKVWSGVAWVQGALRRWTGAVWEEVTLRRWTGSTWEEV